MSAYTDNPDKLVVEGLQSLPGMYRDRIDTALAELAEVRKRQRALIGHIGDALKDHANATAPFRVGDVCEWRSTPWSNAVRVKVLDVLLTARVIPANPEYRQRETFQCARTYRCRAIVNGRAVGKEYAFGDADINKLTKADPPSPGAERATKKTKELRR